MAKYGGSISGMSTHSAHVAPAPTVSKAPRKAPAVMGAAGGRPTGSALKRQRVQDPQEGGAVGGVGGAPAGRGLSEGTVARRFNLKPVVPSVQRTPPLEKPLIRPKQPADPVSKPVQFARSLGDKPRSGGFAATVPQERLAAAKRAAASQQVTGLGGLPLEAGLAPKPAAPKLQQYLPGPSPGVPRHTMLKLSGAGQDPVGGDDDDTDEGEAEEAQTPKEDPRSPFPRGPLKIPQEDPRSPFPRGPLDLSREREDVPQPDLSPSPEPGTAQGVTREVATRLRSPPAQVATAPVPAPAPVTAPVTASTGAQEEEVWSRMTMPQTSR